MLAGVLERSGFKTKKHPTGKTMTVKMNEFDDRTMAQLQAAEFSGIRSNDLWNRFEIWILGQVADTVSYQQFFVNPNTLNETYCKVFGLHDMQLDDATKKDIARLEMRRQSLGDLTEQEKEQLGRYFEEANKK